jgi:dihydroorotate dehydrogenase
MRDLFHFFRPLLFRLDPETAHRLTVKALALGLLPPAPPVHDDRLETTVLGLDFPNPLGMAAGFDKHAEAVAGVLRLGFGFVEVGTITPRPQPGNPRPRVFRLVEDGAVINRYGFNSRGHAYAAARLAAWRAAHGGKGGLVGVNLGANKDSSDRAEDYAAGLLAFAGLADYFVINISSPNTPGLRELQGRAALADLLARLGAARRDEAPLLLKIAPDLSGQDREDIAEVALDGGIDGLIISNTTIERPADLISRQAGEAGGLSGRPLFAPSTRLLADMYRLTGGRLALIGVGGITSGRDAYDKILAGASLVQLYSALVFEGPALVPRVLRELADLLKADGVERLSDAVGQNAS